MSIAEKNCHHSINRASIESKSGETQSSCLSSQFATYPRKLTVR